jgi:hypothetical protein
MRGERLLHVEGVRVMSTVTGDHIEGVTRHKENFDGRLACLHVSRNLRTADPGHDHIAQQQIDGSFMTLAHLDGLRGTFHVKDTVSMVA